MITLFWFRRDLRLHDNAGLFHALKNGKNVQPIFIFDKDILDKLENKNDKRVQFIHAQLQELQKQLTELGATLLTFYGKPLNVFKQLAQTFQISKVIANHDYEPYAIYRDEQIRFFLAEHQIEFLTYKDQCIFEKNEITKDDGKPYTIFTPYMRKWKSKLIPFHIEAYPTEQYFPQFRKANSKEIVSLESMGFCNTPFQFPDKGLNQTIISNYTESRNYPALQKGTSKLSIHLRFGIISIREVVKEALQLNETWLNELIWRDFYMMILWHFPHVVNNSFKPQYDAIAWLNNEAEFQLWCEGKTGYPIVDAGMRELNETGFMHNRVRMIVASFLTKHLLIDWRWGEAYFASKLNDFDLSANNGGWQWAAGSGCDAAPYFRIFNPAEQTKKFDAAYQYIKRWVPEYLSAAYPQPIVDHKFARERCLSTYKKGLGEYLIKGNQESLF